MARIEVGRSPRSGVHHARVVLSDESRVGRVAPSGVRLPAGEVPVPVLPSLTVWARGRAGFTSEGDPIYDVEVQFAGDAVVWEERDEIDDAAGTVTVTARAVLLVDDDVSVDERCRVTSDGGLSWAVSRVERSAGAVTLTMRRIDA